MINIGIVGGTGFTAGELLRLLAFHPHADVQWVYSRTNAGKHMSAIHADLEDDFDLHFTADLDWNIDLVFLCMPHGTVADFLSENTLPSEVKIVDLSNEFRLENQENYVYGLPELNRSSILQASKIANPGCFASCIQFGLLPLAKANELNAPIHITAITGSTGAGKSLSPTTHFTWRTGNLSVYKSFKHQHLAEIIRSLTILQSSFDQEINFVPMRGNFQRGILASIYLDTKLSQEEALNLYENYYESHPFVYVSDQPVDMKQVVNTNRAKMSVNVIDGKIHIVSTIDNLLKGASGQAVQNMNLMFGLEEKTGLNLKSIGY